MLIPLKEVSFFDIGVLSFLQFFWMLSLTSSRRSELPERVNPELLKTLDRQTFLCFSKFIRMGLFKLF